MKFFVFSTAVIVILNSLFALAEDWPQFRGPVGTSSTGEKLDIDWEAPDVVAWKSALPGRGPASPIVVGNKVLVTASSGVNQDRLHVLCFDATTGKQLWQRQFWATGRTITHPSSAVAAPTPASDGERVFAFYSSNDLIALDLDGNLLWYRPLAIDYPRTGNDVGMSSSPVVVDGVVVVQAENQGNSFAAGIDAATGETKWRVDRTPGAAWCSPAILPGNGDKPDRVLLQSPDKLTAHDAQTGREVWMYKGACDGISSVGSHGTTLFLPSEGITALDVASSETSPAVAWKANQLNPGAASPIVADDQLFVVNRGGVLVSADPKSGDIRWRLRLEGSFWSTPSLTGNTLVCCAESGLVQVVTLPQDNGTGEVAAKIDLGEGLQGSPAVANGAVFIRSDKHLYRLGNPQS